MIVLKYALITGGASGMGRSSAIKLSENGFHVFSCDIKVNKEEVDNITQIVMDVTDYKSIENAYLDITNFSTSVCPPKPSAMSSKTYNPINLSKRITTV